MRSLLVCSLTLKHNTRKYLNHNRIEWHCKKSILNILHSIPDCLLTVWSYRLFNISSEFIHRSCIFGTWAYCVAYITSIYSIQFSSLLLYSRFLTSFLWVSIHLCPQLPIWVKRSHHHLPNHVAFEFSSLLLVFLILPSVISCKSLPCVKTWPIHWCFFC